MKVGDKRNMTKKLNLRNKITAKALDSMHIRTLDKIHTKIYNKINLKDCNFE